MTTVAEAAKFAGIEDPDTFALAEKKFARRYGCEPRGTGRTWRAMLVAVAWAQDGHRVGFYARNFEHSGRLNALIRSLFGPWIKTSSQRGVTIFHSGGEIHFFRRGMRPPGGVVTTRDVYDDYIPKGAPPHQHRTTENGKHCVTCGERLRGRELEEARVRRALVRENPGYARAMGILDEPKFSSESTPFRANRLLDGRFFQ